MNIKQKLNKISELEAEIKEYFGCIDGWTVYPFDDKTDFYWFNDDNQVHFAENKNDFVIYDNDIEATYSSVILKGKVYRKEDFTMICLDTECDNNVFLTIFDNKKEIKR